MKICEFCYREAPADDIPSDWDIVWQSLVCPDCQWRVLHAGGYATVSGGAFATKRDPRVEVERPESEREETPC
jgi:hypothetical protein